MTNSRHFRTASGFALPAGLLLTAAVILLIYSNTYKVPFVFDDIYHIVDDPAIRMADLSWDGIKTAALEGKPRHRWIPNVSWALHYRFHGYEVAGYHVVNLMLHLANVFLLFAFIRFTLSRFGMPAGLRDSVSPETVAFAAALIWAVHPLHTQSVTFIYQRMTSMAALFFLLSLLLYARARSNWDDDGRFSRKAALAMSGCALSGLCAMVTKENTVMLPVVILLYEWFFFQELSISFLKKRFILFSISLVFLAGMAFLYLGDRPFDSIMSLYNRRDFTLVERVMTEWRVVIYYISLLLFPDPTRLNLDPDYPLSHFLIQPVTTLLSLSALVAVGILVIYMARRNRLAAFCILWFLVNLVVESSVIGLEIIFEHRTYLPSMLLPLPFLFILFRGIRPKPAFGAVCILALVFSGFTYQRNLDWNDTLAFARDRVRKSPEKARPNLDMGAACSRSGMLEEALSYYQRALELGENPATIFFNMGEAYDNKGEVENAIRYYAKTLELAPGHQAAGSNISRLLIQQQRYRDAMVYLERALAANPTAEAHVNAGIALVHQKMSDEAISHFQAALDLQPLSAEAHNNLGVLLIRKGDIRGAQSHFIAALRIRPDYAGARENLAKLRAMIGNP